MALPKRNRLLSEARLLRLCRAKAAWLRAGWLTLLVGGGAGVYFGLLFACGFRLRDFVWRESLPRAEPAENPA